MKKIQAAHVVRDDCGEWHHPDLPSFDEGDAAKFQAWLDQQGLQPMRVHMEDDAEALHDRYCDGDTDALLEWQPRAPAGDGWFILAIADTEDDGPVAYFVRTVAEAPK